MKRRSPSVMLFVAIGLVPMASQTAIAGKPTTQHLTAAATFLPAATNDPEISKHLKSIDKFIGNDGQVSVRRDANSRPIIIIDLP